MRQPRLTQQEFSRRLWRAVIPPLLLLAGHAAIISILLMYWVRMNHQSRQVDAVLARTTDLDRHLVSMESGVRGFLLTGQEGFFEPYVKARGRVELAFSELTQSLSGRSAQLERLGRVRELFQHWTEAEQSMRRQPTTQPRDPQLIRIMAEQRRVMETIRGELRQMMLTEADYKATQQDREEWAAAIGVIGAIGVSIMAGIGLALINRGTVLRLSQEYQQALDDEAASHRQFLDLAEAVPQLIWITDGEGRRLYFNRPWTEYTGRAAESLSAEGWESNLHPDDAKLVSERWEHSRKTGAPFESECRMKRGSDGAYRWFLCRATPVVDKLGHRVRWFGTCTDIEAKKNAEQQRENMLNEERAAKQDLMRASQIKDQFLATLSHELRTPMGAILGWARLLRDPNVREHKMDRALDAIDANAKAQARLIDDLLDMSRIISGKLTIQREIVDLRQVVQAAVDSVGPAAEEKGVRLSVEMESDRFQVFADSARLQQVIWNILSNAIKFTPAGGSVRLIAERMDDMLRIVIVDTGQGIDPQFLPYVFDRFRQADGSTTRRHGGLGLGLAIVKYLVELHGGKVAAFSEGEGHGAAFTIDLPAAPPDPAPTRAAPAAPPADFSVLADKRILIVDDDAESAAITQTVLDRAGVRTHVVHSAGEALDELDRRRFDAMVSDIAMPGMDGCTLVQRIREAERGNGERLPALALSAFARLEDRRNALAAGFHAHLSKPVLPDDLLRGIASLLSQNDHK